MESNNESGMHRRQLLSILGASAIAGCGGNGGEKRTSVGQLNKERTRDLETDCVDKSQYEHLRNQYDSLREQHEKLRNKLQYANTPPYVTANRRKMIVTYEDLNGEFRTWQWGSSTLSSQNTAGNIVREFTYSQLEYLQWNVFGFQGNSKYRQLGDFGLFYQLNPFVIPSNFFPISKKIYNRYQTDQKRIQAAWNFATQINSYVSDITETPRFPLETLLMGGGDCEDSAILLASLLYSMPVDLGVKFWYIDANNPTNPEDINHVILSVEKGNESLFLETTSNIMTPYNRVNGFSEEIDPTNHWDVSQSRIEFSRD